MDACVIKENKDKLYIVQPSRKSYQKKLHSGDNELLSYLEENIADIKKKKDIIIAIDDSTLRKFVNKPLSRKPAKFSRLKYTPEVIQILYELQFLTKENAIHYLELLLQTNYFRKKLTDETMETLTLRIPKKMHELMEDLASILSLNKTQLARKLLLENLKKEAFKTALELYQKREISLLKASKLAGMHVIELFKLSTRRKRTRREN